MGKIDLLDYLSRGSAAASEVADAFAISEAAAAMACLRAVRQGLLHRDTNPDQRPYRYILSRRGRERRAYLDREWRTARDA
jgi:DNA-binding MarR family transcriptional regulator